MNDEIQKLLECAAEEVRATLPSIDAVSLSDARGMLEKYIDAILPNFVFWMTGAMIFARSSVAKNILERNLDAEISENHPELLRSFGVSAGVSFGRTSVQLHNGFSTMCAAKDGLSLVASVAAMEKTSLIFVPFLAQLSLKCGGTDLRYTQVHGAADVDHATECLRALVEETLHYDHSELLVQKSIQEVVRLWQTIFS